MVEQSLEERLKETFQRLKEREAAEAALEKKSVRWKWFKRISGSIAALCLAAGIGYGAMNYKSLSHEFFPQPTPTSTATVTPTATPKKTPTLMGTILTSYRSNLNLLRGYNYEEINRIVYESIGNLPPLNQKQITEVVQTILSHEMPSIKTNEITTYNDLFFTRFIGTSYYAGYNHFIVSNREPIAVFGRSLLGKDNDPLMINITGDIGSLGHSAEYTHFIVKGNVSLCGEDSERCTFRVDGNTEGYLGHNSNDSIYFINGVVGTELGDRSSFCKFTVMGNVGDSCGDWSNNAEVMVSGNVGAHLGINARDGTFTIKGSTGDYIGHEARRSTFIIFGTIGQLFYRDGFPSDCTFICYLPETYQALMNHYNVNNNTIKLSTQK
ncbi:hypothetical protein HZB02_02375 [Candidatus Woesearchaeota archaeon]|nr:hypothetical protein [Candidatus Woesearchaeota archaeon]